MCSATARVNAYCASLSTLTLTTPFGDRRGAASSARRPLLPWNTYSKRAPLRRRERLLSIAQDLRPQLYVARLLHPVHVA